MLSSTLVVAAVAVLLLGVPLGLVVTRLINDEAVQQLRAQATLLLSQVEYTRIEDRPIDADELQRQYPSRYVQIFARNSPTVIVGVEPPPARQMTEETRSESGVYVRITRDRAQVERNVRGWLMLIVALAGLALAVAVSLAVVQSRRLTLPLLDLARIAERLGSGEARPSRHRYGIPELDRVAEVLDRSATRIADLLGREREFATDASHQLRTPLTGLTMRLEEIVAAADQPSIVREEGEAAIVQAERLTAVIDELLAAARRQRHAQAEAITVDDVLRQQVTEWEPAFRRSRRSLRLAGDRGLRALVSTGGLSQVLSTLLENSLEHGAGPVTITTGSSDRSVVIEVADEGPGIPEHLRARVFDRNVSGAGGTGLGLTLARALTAADGGRLELVRARPAAFALFLRPAEQPAARYRVVSGPA
ncbi:two-component sensor histidine kinase [Sphaerisporangium rufum]|uniref:Signal transduction histidine-protein kinase/phosphatase MprB n=1 Tax=Sphaerisporangium rufum TaxID=1381558 RepID=A0A919R1R9_9ACTN|nr:two-component sensor histidine kinase [Sphaerisporangium rufum]